MGSTCGLDITHCDECDTELEVGQVGLCEDCTPEQTEFKFSGLSDRAKERAREGYKSRDYPHDDWWDGVYEDANHIAKILGLDIESTRTLRGGGTVLDIDISFSGFWSQGDGASFKGSYRYNPKAVDEINAYCNDAELIRIASELTAMQIAQRLLGYDFFTARITTSVSYNHSYSMDSKIHDWGTFADDSGVGEVNEDEFAQLMRDFADWIYKSLENEHDYLTSNEVVDEHLVDEIFDECGNSL